MTGKRLLRRILLGLAGAFAVLLFAAVVQSEATPIRPDFKKLLAQPQETSHFPVARAGWDGRATTHAQLTNATLEEFGPAGTARVARESLISAAMPDYRALAGILLVILLLRRIRTQSQKKVRPPVPPVAVPAPQEEAPPDTARAA